MSGICSFLVAGKIFTADSGKIRMGRSQAHCALAPAARPVRLIRRTAAGMTMRFLEIPVYDYHVLWSMR